MILPSPGTASRTWHVLRTEDAELQACMWVEGPHHAGRWATVFETVSPAKAYERGWDYVRALDLTERRQEITQSPPTSVAPQPLTLAHFATPREIRTTIPQWPQVLAWEAERLVLVMAHSRDWRTVSLTEAGWKVLAPGVTQLSDAIQEA